MILSYKDKRSERFAQGEHVRAFQGFEQQAERRLAILNASPSLDTLRALPGNRLEALKGDRAGQYSIRINQQWRICFAWETASQDRAVLKSWTTIDERRPHHVQASCASGRHSEGRTGGIGRHAH